MQYFGDPNKQPLDQEDLMCRIREMEQLSTRIESELDLEQRNPDFNYWVLRYQIVRVEVKRILMHAARKSWMILNWRLSHTG